MLQKLTIMNILLNLEKSSGKVEGAGIYLKTDDGYIAIFDAVTR